MDDAALPPPGAGTPPPKLELEPAVDDSPPAIAYAYAAPATAVAELPPPRTAPLPAKERRAAEERRALPGSILGSIAAHILLVALVWLVVPYRTLPAPEPPSTFHIDLRDWHWVGDDPEATGSGPRGPGERAKEPPKGEEKPLGLKDDATKVSTAIGLGGVPAGSAYAGRTDGKSDLLAAGGGDGETEGALHLALDWLARHQNADGTWSASDFRKRCGHAECDGPSEEPYVDAATALALLPFLGAGHTHLSGPWTKTVKPALDALVRRQRPDGSWASDTKHAYASAFATVAVCEAFGLSRDPALDGPARKAARYWITRQSGEGGWRYDPGGRETDSSVTGWVALGLVAAKKAGIDVPDRTFEGIREWYSDQTDAQGNVGYTSMALTPRALLGVGYFVPVMTGARKDSPRLLAVIARLESSLPRWPEEDDPARGTFGVIDPLHWYYGGLAAFQRGGGTWTIGHAALRPLLLTHQERRGCAAGSWPPVGLTGARGGRVVMTALCALSLEVYYRYAR